MRRGRLNEGFEHMNNDLSPQDAAFRDEVRGFLDERFTANLRTQSSMQSGVFAHAELNRRWHRILFEKGWVAPSWPAEYGGPGWSIVQRYIFETECAAAGTPALPAMGLRMCGPVLMRYGSAEQKAFFLPRMLSGEHYWCQGYSEPGAGSDLASLGTRAARNGDHYVVNGSKIWTTHAHFANWIFLLVRTNPDAKPQKGISFLLTPMDTPGITVKPIITLAGEHEVNQVFFDDVRIPVGNLIGPENEGWTVAKYLLEFERGGGSAAAGLMASLRRLRGILSTETDGNGGTLSSDPYFQHRMAELEAQVMGIDTLERSVIAELSIGRSVGESIASLKKLNASETGQRINTLAMEAIGFYAVPDQRNALAFGSNESPIGPDYGVTLTARYLNNRAATVFGGSSEVQRNILARSVLGL